MKQFDEKMESKQAEETEVKALRYASSFNNEKLIRKAFTNLVWNLINKRQINNAVEFYKGSLAKKAFDVMAVYTEKQRDRGSLNEKANRFRRKSIKNLQ